AFDTVALGNVLTSYTLTPDGKVLLVDEAGRFQDAPLRIVAGEVRPLRTILGPDVRLMNYVLTADSTPAFVADRGLLPLGNASRSVSSISIAFTPARITLPPDASLLLLGDERSDDVWLYSLVAEGESHRIEAPGILAGP